MGLEAQCEVRWARRASKGRAQLESAELLFRGRFRLQVPLQEVTSVTADKGVLSVAWPGGTARFALGPQAERWALKIRSPRTLMDKLGIKPDLRVSVLGVHDKAFWAELEARTHAITEDSVAPGSDIVVVELDRRAELPRLTPLKAKIVRNGAIWVFWPKGRKEVGEDDVRNFAKRIGLVDVKVASVSEVLSGLKLVIPVSQR